MNGLDVYQLVFPRDLGGQKLQFLDSIQTIQSKEAKAYLYRYEYQHHVL